MIIIFQILYRIKCRGLQNVSLCRLLIITKTYLVFASAKLPLAWHYLMLLRQKLLLLLSWSRKREIKQKTLSFVVPAHFKNVPPKITKPLFSERYPPKKPFSWGKLPLAWHYLMSLRQKLFSVCIYILLLFGPEN